MTLLKKPLPPKDDDRQVKLFALIAAWTVAAVFVVMILATIFSNIKR